MSLIIVAPVLKLNLKIFTLYIGTSWVVLIASLIHPMFVCFLFACLFNLHWGLIDGAGVHIFSLLLHFPQTSLITYKVHQPMLSTLHVPRIAEGSNQQDRRSFTRSSLIGQFMFSGNASNLLVSRAWIGFPPIV